MSTKVTIKSRSRTKGEPGFHLYDDILEEWKSEGGATEPPVFLSLEGVEAKMRTVRDGAEVTIKLPRELARVLGLVP